MTIEATIMAVVEPIMAQLLEEALTTVPTVIIQEQVGPTLPGVITGHHLKIGSIAELLDLVVQPQELHVPHQGTVVPALDLEAEDSVNKHQPRLTTLCNT